MKRTLLLVVVALLASPVKAGNNSVNSEFSHAVGGAAMAGAFVWASDAWCSKEDRGWVGFYISTALGAVSQYYEYERGTNTGKEAFLDAASHALGSAIGAYVTDRYLLTPVIAPEEHGTYVGLTVSLRY
ncbi:hypothetical protein [Vibrio fluvialis]|uniref:hypothetical protein n=1 Tax=Vibrio fluvialis TaxID=676 RepID=UPI000CEB795F|nr:hypothetical protein [Vibrio fluvialis]AVH33655.1 hypothetical protein AL475_17245 [Vibrio fluvialis]TOY94560.1 hypothetical protein DJ016_05750 [Vibrio fluvialis]TRN10328.1 hypothetical protein DM587_16350 [Vibrio fluvialis]